MIIYKASLEFANVLKGHPKKSGKPLRSQHENGRSLDSREAAPHTDPIDQGSSDLLAEAQLLPQRLRESSQSFE